MHAPIATAGVSAGGFWKAEPEWKEETAFLVCGGPSVLSQNLELLRGRRVMVVNSSCFRIPWADILFFGDERWGREYSEAVNAFRGRVVSVREVPLPSPKISYLFRPSPKDVPDGLSQDPQEVWFKRTSVRGAINLLCHLGVEKIVTLGLDGGPDSSGRKYHHKNHPWVPSPSVWAEQRDELGGIVTALKERGVTLLNASPASSIPFWPIVPLESCL